MLRPYFKIVDGPGVGGKNLWIGRFLFLTVAVFGEQSVSSWWISAKMKIKSKFNPYFDLQSGGLTFGVFGKNVWLSIG